MIDFVHPATTHDETIVTLHSLLDRDVYRGGAIVVGPVRRGRGRRVRVERRVVPVSDDSERRLRVLERELWRIAVENLELLRAARLGGARRRPGQPARLAPREGDAPARPDQGAAPPLPAHLRAAQPQPAAAAQGAGRDRRAARRRRLRRRDRHRSAPGPATTAAPGPRSCSQALAERRIGRRDQAQAWVWRLADYTRDLHEEYAVQRWPETKRLLGLLVNSSGRAHGRNARRLVHAARNQDRRLAAALLAAGVAHTPEGEEVLRGARMRDARKPSAVARELLRNFPKAGGRRRRRKRKGCIRRMGAPPRRTARPRRRRPRPSARTSETRSSRSTTSRSPTAKRLRRPRPTRSSRPPRRPTRADSPLHGEVDLAGAQRHSLSVVPLDHQVAVLVDFLDDALAAVPGDPLARERIAGPVGAQDLVVRCLEPAAE